MTQRTECDRCKKIILDDRELRRVSADYVGVHDTDRWDLCARCWDDVLRALNERPSWLLQPVVDDR